MIEVWKFDNGNNVTETQLLNHLDKVPRRDKETRFIRISLIKNTDWPASAVDRIPRDLTCEQRRSCSISARLTKSGGVARNAPVRSFDWHFGDARLSQKSRTPFVPPIPSIPPFLRFFASPYNSTPQHYLSLISIQAIYPLSSRLTFLYFLLYLIILRGSFSFCIVSLSACVKITEREPMLGYRSKSTKTTRHVRKLPLSTFQPSPPCSHPGARILNYLMTVHWLPLWNMLELSR